MRGVVISQTAEKGSAQTGVGYWLHWFDRHGQLQRQQFSEAELVPAPPPKPETVVDALAWIKDLCVSEQDYEVAAVARDFADKVQKRLADKK